PSASRALRQRKARSRARHRRGWRNGSHCMQPAGAGRKAEVQMGIARAPRDELGGWHRHEVRIMSRLVELAIAAVIVFTTGAVVAEPQSDTFRGVKQGGGLNCGVNPGLPGFGQSDDKGDWRGFDVDYCKAIAAAVLGDADKVSYVPANARERFALLQNSTVDVLIR